MRILIGAAVAALLATPALARDDSWYVGVEGGPMLVEDIEMDRQPRAIEERIDGLQSRLAQARTMGDEIIGVTHNSDMRSNLEKMRSGIRQLPHY